MNDRDCENCKHHTEKGCDSWDCNFEPCDIAISKQAVLNILDDMIKNYAKSNDFVKANGVAWVKVQKLPSVNPQKPKTDVFDKIKAEIEVIIENIPHIRPFENIEIVQYTRGFIDGLGSALDLIEKHKAESEDKV